jgi:hypothetical protein
MRKKTRANTLPTTIAINSALDIIRDVSILSREIKYVMEALKPNVPNWIANPCSVIKRIRIPRPDGPRYLAVMMLEAIPMGIARIFTVVVISTLRVYCTDISTLVL